MFVWNCLQPHWNTPADQILSVKNQEIFLIVFFLLHIYLLTSLFRFSFFTNFWLVELPVWKIKKILSLPTGSGNPQDIDVIFPLNCMFMCFSNMCFVFKKYLFSADISSIPLHVVEEMQREEFVQEISELVHRQLVTSTLQGNFRTTLELTMRVRLWFCTSVCILKNERPFRVVYLGKKHLQYVHVFSFTLKYFRRNLGLNDVGVWI